MLNSINRDNEVSFEMEVTQTRSIKVDFKKISSFLSEKKHQKKIIFIDPIVLANQNLFIEFEAEDPNLTLVPTNLIH